MVLRNVDTSCALHLKFAAVCLLDIYRVFNHELPSSIGSVSNIGPQ